jgi:hypothetical protein
MKSLIFTIISALLCSVAFAQSTVTETSIEVKKNRQEPAFSMVVDYDSKTTTKGIGERMSKDSLKYKTSEGFILYKNVVLFSIAGNSNVDLYFKVEGKKNISTVYMLVSKGYNNFVSSSSDAEIAKNIKTFMTNLQTDIYNYNLKLQTDAIQKDVNKKNKQQDRLVKQQDKINSKVEDGAKQISDEKNLMNNLK